VKSTPIADPQSGVPSTTNHKHWWNQANKLHGDNFPELLGRAKIVDRPEWCLVLKMFHHLLWHMGLILSIEEKLQFWALNARRSKSELVTTLTELKAISAPAAAGLRIMPKAGRSIPAAAGIPKML